MFLEPRDVLDHKLKPGLRGYSREAVEELLEDVGASYGQVWRERDALRARIGELEEELKPLRDARRHLGDSLVTAERAAAEVREHAEQQAEELLKQARGKAREHQAEAKRDRNRLHGEIRRLEMVEHELQASLRAFLLAGLELVEDREAAPKAPVVEVPVAAQDAPSSAERAPA
jgi:cell division initiation protein